MRDLAKLRGLSAPDRRLLAACCFAAPVVASAIRVLGFGAAHRAFASLSSAPARPQADGGREHAEAVRVVRVVAIAARHGVVRVSCLGRALLAWWILRTRGIATTIRVGVRRGSGSFGAHAWLEHGGRAIGESEDLEGRFAPFDRDLSYPAPGAR